MEPLAIARTLNELLAAEAMSLVPQLKRTTVFVSWASTGEVHAVDEMVQEEREHEQWLVDAIIGLGGYPNPIRPSVAAGGIHYLELRTLLPLVLREKKRLIARYQQAAGHVASHSRSAALVATILERHRRHAAQIERMTATASATPG